jgi:hypothetical protein
VETKWVKFESWHVVFDEVTTYCGRVYTADDPKADMFEPNEKTCELCLRAMARDEDEDADRVS